LARELAGRVAKHPDQEVRERSDLVFATFLRVKSLHSVIRELEPRMCRHPPGSDSR
jgi:hypothetical protein